MGRPLPPTVINVVSRARRCVRPQTPIRSLCRRVPSPIWRTGTRTESLVPIARSSAHSAVRRLKSVSEPTAKSRRGHYRHHTKGMHSRGRVADRDVFTRAKGVCPETITGLVVMFGRTAVVGQPPPLHPKSAGRGSDHGVGARAPDRYVPLRRAGLRIRSRAPLIRWETPWNVRVRGGCV